MRKSMNKHILTFRVFDFHDRFPEPFDTFTKALEALQSPKAYMPECGDIICYLKNRQEITIPRSFFIESKLRFNNKQEAKAWLIERNKILENSPKKSEVLAIGFKCLDFTRPLAEQIDEALLQTDDEIVSQDKNEAVAKIAAQYLDEKISDIIHEEGKRMRHYKTVTQYKLGALTCDKCHKKVTQDSDCYEFQEFISISHRCGYTSVFEDNAKMTLDLCQHCFKEICGEYVLLNGERNNPTKL